MKPGKAPNAVVIGIAVMAAMIAGGFYVGVKQASASVQSSTNETSAVMAHDNGLTLNTSQMKSIAVAPSATRTFYQQKSATGSVDFNENLAVQVFSPYQGKILNAYAELGEEVKKGAPLFTIDSPDLMQAESALIATSGVYELTTTALKRAKALYEVQGIAQKDMLQAVSDQMTAEGAVRAARNAVRIFGKTDAEIDHIVAMRKIDPVLVVKSPINGRVTARNAQPGLLVQPGAAPAPFAVADTSTMWLLANVPEIDAASFHIGQSERVTLMAFPGRTFSAKVTAVGETIDPNTHSIVLHSEIADPHHELRSGMFANFTVQVGEPVSAVSVPQNAIVREGDGTMTLWTTIDRQHFTRRSVEVGRQQEGFVEIVKGVQPGELVVADGAVFLSNLYDSATQ